ncbi:MAG: hypothetical protein U9P49_10235 [Thermodesulfobacteriota bacterium]|nr:hypothetical protein [Thermodesulfobacteriota bacterium]
MIMTTQDKSSKEIARFMMYFKPVTLNELRGLSRKLNIAMVDFVGAAMEAYIFARGQEFGSKVPPREKKRYVGPRTNLEGKRIRYVMKLTKDIIETLRDIAYFDNRRFTHVYDEAIDDFIRFTKEVNNFKNIRFAKSDIKAVRGRKKTAARKKVSSLLAQYKTMETRGRKPEKEITRPHSKNKSSGKRRAYR